MIGCTLAHLNLWKTIINQKENYVLVLEDDVIIPVDFWERFNIYYKQGIPLSKCTFHGTQPETKDGAIIVSI